MPRRTPQCSHLPPTRQSSSGPRLGRQFARSCPPDLQESQVATGYDPQALEAHWQQVWAEQRLYEVDEDSDKPRFYALTMFPYPSGDLHMGHAEAFSLADAVARHARMRGFEV